MNQEQLEILLGRELQPNEVANLKLFLDIARQRLDSMLCGDLFCSTDDTKVFTSRIDMRTVFTGVFTDVFEVKVDGLVVEKYSPRQWDKRNANWYNSIVFNSASNRTHEIEVSASWGFGGNVPSDMQLLLARAFDLVSAENSSDLSIKNKKVEDFSVTFSDKSKIELFEQENASIIEKYSMCDVGSVHSARAGCL